MVLAVTISETKRRFNFLAPSVMHGVSLATKEEVKFAPTTLIVDAAPALEIHPHTTLRRC